MKRILFSLVAVLLLVLGFVSDQAIKKGDEAYVPDHGWVSVMNPTSISSANRTLSYGDTCSIYRGGKVVVVTLVNEGDQEQVLVHYTTQKVVGGAMCPTGTLFFITRQRFIAMTMEYDRSMMSEQKGRERIWRITS